MRSRLGFVAVGLVVAAAVVGGLLRLHVETGVREFVPRNDAALRTTNQIGVEFGGDPVVVLLESAKPMDLFSKDDLPQMLRLEGELSRLPDVQVVYGPGTVLNQIAAQEQALLAELSGYRDGLRDRAAAQARRRGLSGPAVVAAKDRASHGFDQQYLALLQRGISAGLPTMYNQTFVDHVLFGPGGRPRAKWRFLVPSTSAAAILVRPKPGLSQTHVEALSAAVSAAVRKADLPAARTTVSGVPVVVGGLGREIRSEALLLAGAATVAVSAWFLLVPWTRRRHRLLPVLATGCGTALTLAIAGWSGRPLALTAVAFLPVLLGIGSDFTAYLHKAVPRRVVLASAAASAAGFASLGLTRVPAVADLGISLAIGLVISVLVSLLLVSRFPEAPTSTDRPRREPTGATLRLVVAAVLIVAVGGWIAAPHLQMQADFKSVASGLTAYADAQHVADVMGADGEITVRVEADDVLAPQTVAWMDKVRQDVTGLQPVLSAPELLGFLGRSPTAGQITSAMRLLPAYLTRAAVTPDRHGALLVYGVRLDDADQLAAVRDRIDAAVADPPAGVTAAIGGLPMVAVSARQALVARDWLMAAIGIGAAGLAAGLVLRRRRAVLLAVLSSALAYGLASAATYLAGIPMTPLSAGLGSLTAAVACEFTIVLSYARECGKPMIDRAVTLAAAASATGYAVLLLSRLGPVREFGALLAVTVLVSLLVSRLVVVTFVRKPVPDPAPAARPVGTLSLVEVGR